MFTIDAAFNVQAHEGTPQVAEEHITFATEKEFDGATAGWNAPAFIELWNSFAGTPGFDGLKPVAKFTNRQTAVKRIWKAIQVLAAAPTAEATAPTTAETTEESKEETNMPKTKKTKTAKADKPAKTRAQAAPKAPATKTAKKKATAAAKTAPREVSRKETIVALITRKNGATLGEIMTATCWQAHSVRGFLSTLASKGGYKINSSKNEAGERTYKVTSAPKGGK